MGQASKQLIGVLLRVVQSAENTFVASATLRNFAREHNLGRTHGVSKIVFSAEDKNWIRKILTAEHGVNPSTPVCAWGAANRIDAARMGRNEKLAGKAVHSGRVLIKAPFGAALRINGDDLKLPAGAHLSIGASSPVTLDHDAAIVVENFEVFAGLDSLAIDFTRPSAPRRPLAIYRGDAQESRQGDVQAFLEANPLPVVYFYDLDPASVSEMARNAHMLGAILPASLDLLVGDNGVDDVSRAQLYRNQVGPEFERLADDPRLLIRNLHRTLHDLRRGITQEAMVAREAPLAFYATNEALYRQ